MENDHELNEFIKRLQDEVMDIAETEGFEKMTAGAFTQYMINILVDIGDLEDGIPSYHKARGMEVSGYSLDNDGVLSLFTTIYKNFPSSETVSKGDVEISFKRLETFLQKCLNGYYAEMEEASQAFDMAQHIFENREDIIEIRFYLFTDGLTTVSTIPDTAINKIPVSHHVWDLRRLYRNLSSGKEKELIRIDFVEQFGAPLPCLPGSNTADHAVYLTIFPGNVLSALYQLYGSRLLELNVRSYLQARGKVNQGIRRTILEHPQRFLAYNNGISATASQIDLVDLPGGGCGIRALTDLQIVNGGQTTASIFHAVRKDKADVSQIHVQAKISVIESEDNILNLVPLISRFANSQNKVNEADFSSNESFHIDVEKFSRSIWAPAASGSGTQYETRWFYERARGQYQDAIALEGTPARQQKFKKIHPATQKFTKTDLAKFEMTWNQFPHIVSMGAQKCFVQFTSRMQKSEVDQQYFRHFIAKAILFRQAEKIVSSQNFGGYRANVVTYTLAYIYHHTDGRIDLDRIWQQQGIGQGLHDAIKQVSHRVNEAIIDPPGGKNVTEWCKREECWTNVRRLVINLPASLENELLLADSHSGDLLDEDGKDADRTEQRLVIQMEAIPADVWYQLSTWAKETHNFPAKQRTLAFNIGQNRRHGKMPPRKQIVSGLLMLKEAYKSGFKSEDALNLAD